MANPPMLKPGNWGDNETKFLTITKVGNSDPFVYHDKNDRGDYWIWRVEVENGQVDQEFGRERSWFPSEYQHNLLMKLHEQSPLRVKTKIAVTKEKKKDSKGLTWIIEFAGEPPPPSGASVDSKPPAGQQQQQPDERRSVSPPPPETFNPYEFEQRDKFATPVYTRKQAEEIAKWAVNLADTVAAPGVIEEVSDSQIIINTTERRWSDERARQSNIATWVILAKEIVPTDFGPGYGKPPDLETEKTRFWNLVKDCGAEPATLGNILIERFEPEDDDGGKLTVWNYLTALADVESIVAEGISRVDGPEPDPEPEPDHDPNVDPPSVEDIDEPAHVSADAGITADDIPFD